MGGKAIACRWRNSKERLIGFLDRLRDAIGGDKARGGAIKSTQTSAWIDEEEWRSWDAPLDIVVGESHYQAALRRIVGAPRPAGWFVPCEAALQREPDNPYDADAIAVFVAGEKVGYIDADACGEIAPAMDVFGDNARASGIPAMVRGGWPDKPSLGVLLWLDHEDVRASLQGVNWSVLADDFTCGHWRPREGPRPPERAATSTGHARGSPAGPGFTGEPRTPPLTAHYSDYVEDVKVLKRRKDHVGAEALLLALIDALEEESRANGWGVAPWYYEQLAIVRRKVGDLDGEVAILERYAASPRAPGASAGKLLARLEDARARRDASG